MNSRQLLAIVREASALSKSVSHLAVTCIDEGREPATSEVEPIKAHLSRLAVVVNGGEVLKNVGRVGRPDGTPVPPVGDPPAGDGAPNS